MFQYFDTNKKDEITFEDFLDIHKRNGNGKVNTEDIKQMCIDADPEGKGTITFDTF